MPEEHTENGVRKHLSDKATWLRLVYMVLFGIVVEILRLFVYLVATVQFLFKLFTGEDHPQVRKFGGSLAEYLGQVVGFLAFRSDDKPYPWGVWPTPDATAGKTTVHQGSRGGRRKKSTENGTA